MIPAGYAASIYAWATRPDLSEAELATRQQALLDEQDALVSGKVVGSGKGIRTLTAGTMNGKGFTWSPDVTAAEKLTVITQVLSMMALIYTGATPAPLVHANFGSLIR